MDFTLTEFEGELLDLGRTYAEREIAPVAAQAWHEERCPTELLRGLGELGLLGTLIPEKWGGIGSSTVGYVALLEALATVDPSVATAQVPTMFTRLLPKGPMTAMVPLRFNGRTLPWFFSST